MTGRITVAGALVLGAWCAQAVAQDAKAIERGKQVYAEQKCKLCHSIAGEGNTKGPLDGVGTKLTTVDIKEWMVHPKEMTAKTRAERKPYMKAYPNLPAADLDAVVSYMESLKKK
jgi:mono/diheme cytochrome c family protein